MDFQNENEKILYIMYLISLAEKATSLCYEKGLIPGTFHLCEGEEASFAAISFAKKEGDLVLGTHRSHGEALSLGVSPKELFAEMFGKETGISSGRGGSMHLSSPKKGYIGSNGIVGGNFSIGCGCALSLKMDGEKDRAVFVFTGDGALNEGSFHESLNMASIWKLPMVFLCVDNGYGVSTKALEVSSCHRICGGIKDRIKSYGAEFFSCDGNDVFKVIETIKKARETAIKASPAFVHLETYRTCGHSKSDKNLYRTSEEILFHKECSPIKRFEELLEREGLVPKKRQQEIFELAEKEIKDAVEFAKNSPFPN